MNKLVTKSIVWTIQIVIALLGLAQIATAIYLIIFDTYIEILTGKRHEWPTELLIIGSVMLALSFSTVDTFLELTKPKQNLKNLTQ